MLCKGDQLVIGFEAEHTTNSPDVFNVRQHLTAIIVEYIHVSVFLVTKSYLVADVVHTD